MKKLLGMLGIALFATTCAFADDEQTKEEETVVVEDRCDEQVAECRDECDRCDK